MLLIGPPENPACLIYALHNEHVRLWPNQRAGSPITPKNYKGIRLDACRSHAVRERLQKRGYPVSGIDDRESGQTEFVVTDDDGYSHCSVVPTGTNPVRSIRG